MIYRGYKIERVIFHATDDGLGSLHMTLNPRQRVEYVIFVTVAGFHWQEVGSIGSRVEAKEFADQIVLETELSSHLRNRATGS